MSHVSIYRPRAEAHLADLGIFPGHADGFSYADLLQAVEQLLAKMEPAEYSPESVAREQARGAAFLSAPARIIPYAVRPMPPPGYDPNNEYPPF